MLQALMPRFAQGPLTLDLDVYGSMILDVPLFLSFGSDKGGENTWGVNPQMFLS